MNRHRKWLSNDDIREMLDNKFDRDKVASSTGRLCKVWKFLDHDIIPRQKTNKWGWKVKLLTHHYKINKKGLAFCRRHYA